MHTIVVCDKCGNRDMILTNIGFECDPCGECWQPDQIAYLVLPDKTTQEETP